MEQRILVVDDEQIIRESLAFVLKNEGYHVEEAGNGREALEKHEQKHFDIILTDIEMPEMRGMELLAHVAKRTPQTLVVIITAFGSLETAIEALRKGAFDYVLKPLNFDEIIFRVKKLAEHRGMALENSLLRQELQRRYDFDQIIGQSPPMKKVFEVIRQVASSDGTVLITGKSGTGKELVARALHYHSQRKQKQFVPINCGAIVETLFESELFGHMKGSFTGASTDKEGLLKVADGGTVFLDEVSEIPLNLQVKLLRALEQKEITPVGGTQQLKIDVRIIAATNKDLRRQIENGKFREDLFYRLNVVEIGLPTLSERSEDIPLLAQHFLDVYRKQMGRPIKGFTNDAMNLLMKHEWKGEVRELENTVERAVIFCNSDFVGIGHFPDHMKSADAVGTSVKMSKVGSLKEALKNFERRFIEQTLMLHQRDKEAAAKVLGISLSSLYRKMDELGINHS